MKKKNKIILSVLILGLIVTSLFLFFKPKSKEVKVFNVGMISTPEDWSNQQFYMQGMVTTDQLQPIYVSPTQTITEILVQEGQTVKKGDILLTYDTTLSEISIVKKQLEVQKYQLEIEKLIKELNVINGYKPGVPVLAQSPYQGKVLSYLTGIEPLPERLVINVDFADLKADEFIIELKQNDTLIESQPTLEINQNLVSYNYELDLNVNPPYQVSILRLDKTAVVVGENKINGKIYVLSQDGFNFKFELKPEVIEPIPEPTPEPTPEPIPADKFLLGGKGIEKDPYRVLADGNGTLNMNYIKKYFVAGQPLYVQYQLFTENNPKKDLLLSYTLKFEQVLNNEQAMDNIKFDLIDYQLAEKPPVQEPIEDDPLIDIPIDPGPPTVSYTAAEIAKMKAEKEAEIRNAQLAQKTSQMELENLEIEKNNNLVLAQLDGVVSEIIDIEEAKESQSQLFSVSASGSFIVNTSIPETDLENRKVGDKFTIFSYDTGELSEGTILSISNYPESSNSMMGYQTSSIISMYPVTIGIDKDANLKQGAWVEIRPDMINQGEDYNPNLYLMNAFIHYEDNKAYVFVNENGKLVKRLVKTGKLVNNEYTEILDNGLSIDESIAFPYSNDVVEGAPTIEASMDDLYLGDQL